MSLTVQQMVMDAKKLVKKLRDTETATDNLILKSQNVFKLLDTRKCSEDISQINEGTNSEKSSFSISNVHHGSKHLRLLQNENHELRASIEDYNLAAEIIMSKYREQITRIMGASEEGLNFCTNELGETLQEMPEKINEMTERIQEMGSLMGVAAKLDEEYEVKTAELIARLTVENKGLKDLLCISNSSTNHVS